MENELTIEDLVFQTHFTAKDISWVCCFCGFPRPLDGGYLAAVRIYPNEPVHLFYACSVGCISFLLDERHRLEVDRFLNKQVDLTRKIHQYNKSKNHG